MPAKEMVVRAVRRTTASANIIINMQWSDRSDHVGEAGTSLLTVTWPHAAG